MTETDGSKPSRMLRQLLSDKPETWFAWRPVRLYRFDGHHWVPTREWAWLSTVEVTYTFWGETFYTRIAK